MQLPSRLSLPPGSNFPCSPVFDASSEHTKSPVQRLSRVYKNSTCSGLFKLPQGTGVEDRPSARLAAGVHNVIHCGYLSCWSRRGCCKQGLLPISQRLTMNNLATTLDFTCRKTPAGSSLRVRWYTLPGPHCLTIYLDWEHLHAAAMSPIGTLTLAACDLASESKSSLHFTGLVERSIFHSRESR